MWKFLPGSQARNVTRAFRHVYYNLQVKFYRKITSRNPATNKKSGHYIHEFRPFLPLQSSLLFAGPFSPTSASRNPHPLLLALQVHFHLTKETAEKLTGRGVAVAVLVFARENEVVRGQRTRSCLPLRCGTNMPPHLFLQPP